MGNKTVMQYDDSSVETTYEDSLRKEYEQASKEGFVGTYEEYLIARDYS